MAVWKTDKDIFRDLDILSGIQSPEERLKPYSSWGRGQNHTLNSFTDNTFPEPQEMANGEEFTWFPQVESFGKLPDSIGRGKKLELLKANVYRNREMEVHEQLRQVMGPGHSNTFIEESFKKRLGLKNEHKDLPVEQFQDSEEAQSAHSPILTTSKINREKFVDGQSEAALLDPADSTIDKEAMVPKSLKRQRRKRQYRNALLESLERMNNPENASVENEHANTNRPLSATEPVLMFGTKSSNIPPACYLPGRTTLTYSPKKTENSFEYKESEFPTL